MYNKINIETKNKYKMIVIICKKYFDSIRFKKLNLLELNKKLSIVFFVKYSIINFSPKKIELYINTFLINISEIFLTIKSI